MIVNEVVAVPKKKRKTQQLNYNIRGNKKIPEYACINSTRYPLYTWKLRS